MRNSLLLPGAAPRLRRLVLPALLAPLLLAAAGCTSHRPAGPARRETPQPPLLGHAEFFGGAVSAEARVTGFGATLALRPPHDGQPETGGHSQRRRPRGEGAGMVRPPGGGPRHTNDAPPRARGGAAALPRQTLSVTLANRTDAELTVTITELDSAIGNFAPRPERLTLVPGGSATLEPVSGDAGGNLEWLDLMLALRRDGRTEHQLVHLVATGGPAPEPPAPPPPGTR